MQRRTPKATKGFSSSTKLSSGSVRKRHSKIPSAPPNYGAALRHPCQLCDLLTRPYSFAQVCSLRLLRNTVRKNLWSTRFQSTTANAVARAAFAAPAAGARPGTKNPKSLTAMTTTRSRFLMRLTQYKLQNLPKDLKLFDNRSYIYRGFYDQERYEKLVGTKNQVKYLPERLQEASLMSNVSKQQSIIQL